MYFDGASKGNPREVGEGEVIINLEEKTKVKYAWGLGVTSNNQAKALALWQGLKICLDNGVNSLNIVGDSKLIIQKRIRLVGNGSHIVDETSSIMVRIIYMLKRFDKVNIFHVLRANNQMADI